VHYVHIYFAFIKPTINVIYFIPQVTLFDYYSNATVVSNYLTC